MNNQPTPVAVQQTTVIQVGSQKSVAGAVLLAFFFGPLGMIYATVPGALIMLVINIFVAIVTLGLGLLFTLPICAIWAGVAASSHNKRLGFSSQQAALAGQASPAGWHPDPDGSGRLRYYDGIRWTDNYAHQAEPQPTPPPEQAPALQLEQSTKEESDEADVDEAGTEAPTQVVASKPEQISCGSCGESISPTAQFCSTCGESQAVA